MKRSQSNAKELSPVTITGNQKMVSEFEGSRRYLQECHPTRLQVHAPTTWFPLQLPATGLGRAEDGPRACSHVPIEVGDSTEAPASWLQPGPPQLLQSSGEWNSGRKLSLSLPLFLTLTFKYIHNKNKKLSFKKKKTVLFSIRGIKRGYNFLVEKRGFLGVGRRKG